MYWHILKFRSLGLCHLTAGLISQILNIHKQCLRKKYSRRPSWNPYHFFGIYIDILLMLNHCNDKNRIHFCYLLTHPKMMIHSNKIYSLNILPCIMNGTTRLIIVNYQFIVTRPHRKNLPQNATWKLIIW